MNADSLFRGQPVRLIVDEPASGSWNMSVDEALAESAAEPPAANAARSGVATLRFYQWSPPTLSLGYFQPLADREGHQASLPCPVVRRSTGGGAILHDRELTYSFVAPAKIGDRGAAQHLYDLFHDTLIETLSEFGVEAQRQEATDEALDCEFLCFRRRAKGDLVCRGAKIVGSAQRRSHGAILQHGSILLAASRFAAELPGIEELTGKNLLPVELGQAWSGRLATAAGWIPTTTSLAGEERDAASEIEANRYSSTDWTGKR